MRPEPGGCRWCGILARGHYTRWASTVEFHQWTAPTREQIRERMFARNRWQVYKRRNTWYAAAPHRRGKVFRRSWQYATWAEAMHRATVTGNPDDIYTKAG